MFIKPLHENFKKPTKGSEFSAAFDIYMPEAGEIKPGETVVVPLGFASSFSIGFVALLLPRSGTGFKYGLELNNTCGVIDSDFRGEWKASLKLKDPNASLKWEKGDRLLQFLLVPIPQIKIDITDTLEETKRGTGGFGSTGV